MGIIGQSIPVRDAAMKVTGQFKYTADLEFPGMLHAKILFSPVPHARIKKIDTSRAEALEGVRGVVCYLNAPDTKYNSCGEEIDGHKTERVFDDTVRYVGDKVAAVAADTVKIAEQAVKLIQVEYEELPFYTDPGEALKEGAYPIHGESNIIFPVDMGMVTDTKVRTDHKIAYGTQNMTKGPAMTREQAVKGLEAGIDMVRELNDKGYRILATGEMGIGNTTTSSAVASVLLKQPVEEMTGRGAGLTSEGLVRKINAIKKAIALNEPDPEDAIDVLAKVGGLDIAGMAGVFLGGAVYGIPVVMDGFISCVSALIAMRICPAARDYILASHVSKEPAAHLILENMGKEAIIHADMCLGEGTGAVALFPILDLAAAVYHSMSTFDDIHVEQYEELK